MISPLTLKSTVQYQFGVSLSSWPRHYETREELTKELTHSTERIISPRNFQTLQFAVSITVFSLNWRKCRICTNNEIFLPNFFAAKKMRAESKPFKVHMKLGDYRELVVPAKLLQEYIPNLSSILSCLPFREPNSKFDYSRNLP